MNLIYYVQPHLNSYHGCLSELVGTKRGDCEECKVKASVVYKLTSLTKKRDFKSPQLQWIDY